MIHQTKKCCLIACREEKVKAGRCDCANTMFKQTDSPQSEYDKHLDKSNKDWKNAMNELDEDRKRRRNLSKQNTDNQK